MPLFAVLTIALAGQAALALAFMGNPRGLLPRAVLLFPCAALVPLALHLVLDGPSLAMVPVDVVAAAGAAAGVVAWRRDGKPLLLRGRAARAAGIAASVILAAGLVLLLSPR